jgi:hypothetical protein
MIGKDNVELFKERRIRSSDYDRLTEMIYQTRQDQSGLAKS